MTTESNEDRNVPMARPPMEQIAGAMQVQSDLLRQMHERQRMLEEVVKDNRRHEMMINSTQALNESFQGLQRVQERLADRLDETRGTSRGRFVVLTLAVLALVGVGGYLAWRITRSAGSLSDGLQSVVDAGARDREVLANLERIEARVRGVEEADRAAFRDEIDKLRQGVDALTRERDELRRERNDAMEALGVAKAGLAMGTEELASIKTRVEGLERDNARLTSQAVADQGTIAQLNDLVANLKAQGAAKAPEVAKIPPPDVRDAPKENAALPAALTEPAPARAEPEVAGASSEPILPLAAERLAGLNEMLKAHMSTDRYEMTRAERVGQQSLWDVAFAVRGADGKLNRTIEAQSATFWVKDKLLEVEFKGGNVTFHEGAGGRTTKAPFFNDRYVVVVLLTADGARAWQPGSQPFIRAK